MISLTFSTLIPIFAALRLAKFNIDGNQSTTFSGLMYFRLKQTDYNGDYSYSDVQTIFVGDNEYVILYPTIATDFITIEGDYESVKFIDMQGKIQHPTRMQGNSYPIAALPQGMHYAIISLKNGEFT